MSTRDRFSRSNFSSSPTSPSPNPSSRRATSAGAAPLSSSSSRLFHDSSSASLASALPRSSFVDSSSASFRERRRNQTASTLNNLHSELKFLDVQQELLFDPTIAPDDVRLEGLSLPSASSYQPKARRLLLSEPSSDRLLLPSGKGDGGGASSSTTLETPEEGRRGGGEARARGEEEERDLDRFFRTFTAGASSSETQDRRKGGGGKEKILNSSSSSLKSPSEGEAPNNTGPSSSSSSPSRALLVPTSPSCHTSLKQRNHIHSSSSLPVSSSSSPPPCASLADRVFVSQGDYRGESASDARPSCSGLDASAERRRGRSACNLREGTATSLLSPKMYPRSSSSSYSRRYRTGGRAGSSVDDDLDYEDRQGPANNSRSLQDFHISIHPPKSSSYDDILDRASREDKKAERNAVRFAAATAGAAAAASMLGADVDALQCSVTVEEQERPSPVKDVFDQEDEEDEEDDREARRGMKRQDTSSSFLPQRSTTSIPGAPPSLSKDLSSSSSSMSMIGRNLDRFPSKRAPSRGGAVLSDLGSSTGGGVSRRDDEQDRGGEGSGRVRVYSQSRHVDERKGEGLQPLGRFPFPRGLTEMQERMEEEWIDRERRLRVQHKRELEKAVAHETEKVRSHQNNTTATTTTTLVLLLFNFASSSDRRLLSYVYRSIHLDLFSLPCFFILPFSFFQLFSCFEGWKSVSLNLSYPGVSLSSFFLSC